MADRRPHGKDGLILAVEDRPGRFDRSNPQCDDLAAQMAQTRQALDDALMGVAERGTTFADFVDQVADIVTAMGNAGQAVSPVTGDGAR